MTRRVTLAAVCLVPLALGACTGRKVVVDRNFGRVDSQKSITTRSDPEWKINQEPAPAPAPPAAR